MSTLKKTAQTLKIFVTLTLKFADREPKLAHPDQSYLTAAPTFDLERSMVTHK